MCSRIDVRSQRLSWRCGCAAEVEDSTRRSKDWAELLVAATPETDDFSADTTFLRGKFEGDKRS